MLLQLQSRDSAMQWKGSFSGGSPLACLLSLPLKLALTLGFNSIKGTLPKSHSPPVSLRETLRDCTWATGTPTNASALATAPATTARDGSALLVERGSTSRAPQTWHTLPRRLAATQASATTSQAPVAARQALKALPASDSSAPWARMAACAVGMVPA
eukprot:scaffold228_cov312-Pinguiococcus_pyrenoidosus.AAC.60